MSSTHVPSPLPRLFASSMASGGLELARRIDSGAINLCDRVIGAWLAEPPERRPTAWLHASSAEDLLDQLTVMVMLGTECGLKDAREQVRLLRPHLRWIDVC